MTAGDWIAAALLVAFALLITIHQHRSNTEQPKTPQDGEPRT
ncbi:hypothetical protein [Streptomyces sp. NPDC060001]